MMRAGPVRDRVRELVGPAEFSRLTAAAPPEGRVFRKPLSRSSATAAEAEIAALVALASPRHCCGLVRIEFSNDIDLNTDNNRDKNNDDAGDTLVVVSALLLSHGGTDLRRVLAMAGDGDSNAATAAAAAGAHPFSCRTFGSAWKLGIALGLARAVAFIHEKGWAHLDIKPSNILIRGDAATATVRLADFGFAEPPPATGLTIRRGSPGFIAPEIRTCSDAKGYDGRQADMWSVGLTIVELFLGSKRFDETWLVHGPNKGTEDSQEIVRRTLKALRAVKDVICPRRGDSNGNEGEGKEPHAADADAAAWESCVQRVFRRSIVLTPAARWRADDLVEHCGIKVVEE
jgi:hypothetical protein